MSNDPNQQPQAAAAPAIDPAEYYRTQQEIAELRANQQRYDAFLTQLDPHAPIIKRMLEDERVAGVLSDSVSAYDQVIERSKPKLDPQWDPTQNPYVAKIDKLTELADKWESQSQAAAQAEQRRADEGKVQQAREFLDGLASQYPILRDNENAGLRGIIALTQTENIDIQTAAERMKPLYSGAAVTAPPSLRTDMGASGVPGPSASRTIGSGDIVARATELLRNNGMGR